MRTLIAPLLVALCALVAPARAEPMTIKIATIAPTGSMWHNELKKLGAMWKDPSGGVIKLTIYAGGAMGDEGDIIKKMRIGQLQGGALTSEGLHTITPETVALDLPLQLANDTEYDAVAAKINPLVDAALAAKGFEPLGWTQVGWLQLFSKTARPTLAEARKAKLWCPMGDPALEAMLKQAGFRPEMTKSTDIVPSLTTGLIDAVPTVPAAALALNLHVVAKHITDLRLASLSAALVINKATWDQVPAALRPKLLDSARTVLTKMTTQARALTSSIVTKLKSLGVQVVPVTDAPAWSTAADALAPAIRGKWLPEATYDAVKQAIRDHRASLR